MKKTILLTCAVVAALFAGLNADDKKAAASKADDSSVIGAKLTGTTLHRVDGKKFKEAELKKDPEFYILYYSASW